MTKTAVEFDAKKHRRRYAVFFGLATTTSFLITFLIRGHWFEGGVEAEILWGILLIWGFSFFATTVSGYVIWYSPFISCIRGTLTSLFAYFMVFLSIYCVSMALDIFSFGLGHTIDGEARTFEYMWHEFVTFHDLMLGFGLPYLAAAIVGWCFARPATDVS